MKIKRFFLLLFLVPLLSCNKDHTCYCTNPGGTVPVFTYKGPRGKANKMCKDYAHNGTPGNETSCKLR